MDALDVRILRAMGPLPYKSAASGADAVRPAHIAREVGVSPETARDRIARLEAVGVIGGYEIVPNLRHFGMEASAFLLASPDEATRERLRGALDHVEGILEVTWFLGTHTCVDLAFQTPGQRERRLHALAAAAGDASPEPFLGWDVPPVRREPTPLDWRILQALRGRAKRSLVEVAEEIGVGYRTVKRHYDRMAEENAFRVKPLLDPAREPGVIPFTILFHFAPGAEPAATRQILDAFDDVLVFAQPTAPRATVCFDVVAFANGPKEMETLRQRAAAIPGVTRAQALVPTDVDTKGEWIDELIALRASGGR